MFNKRWQNITIISREKKALKLLKQKKMHSQARISLFDVTTSYVMPPTQYKETSLPLYRVGDIKSNITYR